MMVWAIWSTSGQSYNCDFDPTCDWVKVGEKMPMLVRADQIRGGPSTDASNETTGNFGVFWVQGRGPLIGESLRTPWIISDTSPSCTLSMATYAMYLNECNRDVYVNVYINGSLKDSIIPAMEGWNYSKITLGRIAAPYRLGIGLSKNVSTYCMVSVDDIAMINCSLDGLPRNAYCTFDEEDDHFIWQQGAYRTGLTWRLHNGSTPTLGTGPDFDHTKRTGYYMYVEAGDQTDKAVLSYAELDSSLFMPPPQETQEKLGNNTSANSHFGSCQFSFAHHLYASHNLGTENLILYVVYPCSDDKAMELWKAPRKNKDWMWETVSLTHINQPFILRFTANIDNIYETDFAVDDLSLSPSCFGVGIPDYLYRVDALNDAWADKLEVDLVGNISAQCKEVPMATKFSTCGAQGQRGPTHDQCNQTYKSETNKVKVSGLGIQTWIVPQAGQYSITALGASGGSGARSVGKSRGGYVHGKFNLTKGQKLHIIVGQKGWNGCSQIGFESVKKICGGDMSIGSTDTISGGGGGGGGATFVFEGDLTTEDLTPLLIAGGGGGLGYNMTNPNYDKWVEGGWGLGGIGCSGYTDPNGAGGGGGWNGSTFFHTRLDRGWNVSNTSTPAGASGARNVSNETSEVVIDQTGQTILHSVERGKGGSACQVAINQGWNSGGGFGGGGGGCFTGGGGGGYTGGNASQGTNSGSINGMGGTSFISPKAVEKADYKGGHDYDHGAVEIHLVISCPCDFLCVVQNAEKKKYVCHCPPDKTLAEDKHSCVDPNYKVTGTVVNHALLLGGGLGLVFLLFLAVLASFLLYKRTHKRIKREMPQSLSSETDPALPPRPLGRRTDVNPIYDIRSTMANDSLTQDLTQIPRDSLRLVRPLGQGAFGEVYEGILSNYGTEKYTLPVAVKTLPSISTDQAKLDFLMEAVIISKFKHPNIVQFIGICMEKHPGFIVLELLEGGDLKTFLRESRCRWNEPSPICVADLLKLSLDVAKGCKHLEQDHFIHRDIAARNCLLTSKSQNRVAKIADFGMARDIYRADYYKKGGQAMLPVKWMPPEAFMDGIFTTKTDAWSFGVLLWEVFSMGLMPYPGCSNQDVMEFVTAGGRMETPDKCPAQVYDIMVGCWHVLPERRPSFSTLIKKLISCSQSEEVINAPLPRFYSTSTHSAVKPTPPTSACEQTEGWSLDTMSPSSTAPLLPPQSPDALADVNQVKESDSEDESYSKKKTRHHKTAFNKLHPPGYQPIPGHDPRQQGAKPVDRGRLSFDFTHKNNAVPLIPSVLSGSSPNIATSGDPDINFVDSILRRSHQTAEKKVSVETRAPQDSQC